MVCVCVCGHLLHRRQVSGPVLQLVSGGSLLRSQSSPQVPLVGRAGVQQVEPTGHRVSSPVRHSCRREGPVRLNFSLRVLHHDTTCPVALVWSFKITVIRSRKCLNNFNTVKENVCGKN